MSVERFGQGKGLNPEVRKTEKRISDEELSSLLSSLGNHEAKALTLVLMEDGNIYTKGDLLRRIISSQGDKIGWRMDYRLPFGYCEYSLSPIGLVAKEIINQDLSIYGYQITQKGKDLGVPLAGLLLDFSLRYPEISLFDLFGPTNSSSTHQLGKLEDGTEIKKRSPFTRIKILWELATSLHSLRAEDIAKSVGENASIVGFHLQELSAKGIIGYKTEEYGKPYAFYRLNPDHSDTQPPKYRSLPSLTNNVFELFKSSQDNRWWTMEEISRRLGYKCITDIRGILSHLARTGYLIKGEFSKEKQSEASLSPEQREMIVDLLNILYLFASKDPKTLAQGRYLAEKIINNHDLVSSLMQKAKEHSPSAKRQPQQETAKELLSIIFQYPGITIKELQEEYKKTSGRRITDDGIRKIVVTLLPDKITTQKIKDVNHYSPKTAQVKSS